MVRDAILIVEDERRDGVQRIEQKVGVQLIAQHLQLRFLRERGCFQRRFALLLQRLVVLDSEVQSAPAQQEISRRQRPFQDLE